MAKTIIEELIVELGLDDSKLVDQAREADRHLSDSKERIRKGGNEIESGVKRQRSAFAGLQRELVGILALFTAGAGIKQFIASTVQSDAAVGRLSKQIGVSTEDLSIWQGVLRQNGGSADSATNALSTLTNAYEQFIATGNAGLPYLQQLGSLGFRMEDLKNPTEGLIKLSEIAVKLDPKRWAFLGRQLGFDPAMIDLMAKGPVLLRAQLEEQKKISVVTDENAAAAERLQKRLSILNQRWTALGRNLLTSMAPVIEKVSGWLEKLSNWASRNQGAVQGAFLAITAGIVAIGLALAAANAPLIAVIGGLTLLGAGFGKMVQESPALQNAMQEVGLAFGDLGSAVSDLWNSFTNTAFAKWFGEQLEPGGVVVKGLTGLINGLATAISALAAVMRGDWVSGLGMIAAVMRGDFVGAMAIANGAAEEEKKRRPARAAQAQARAAANNNAAPASNAQNATDLIKEMEGFREKPYWDVTAYRAGYGSDTKTDPVTGQVSRVTPSTRVDRAAADADLKRRIDKEFLPKAMRAVGAKWKDLDKATQAALVSITYNYGHLPESVAKAAKSGNRQAIADAIRARGVDNAGVNADRRSKEAALVLKGAPANENVQYAARSPARNGRAYQPRYAALPAGARGLSTAPGRSSNTTNRTNQIQIDKIEVVTQARDADKIAREIGPAINRHTYVTQANRGLA